MQKLKWFAFFFLLMVIASSDCVWAKQKSDIKTARTRSIKSVAPHTARFPSSKSARHAERMNSSNIGSDIQKPLEVRGQSRTISMGLVLKSKREQIDFIKPRTNYDQEIMTTKY